MDAPASASAALEVMTNPALFSLTTSFQRGVPVWAVEYECMFNPPDDDDPLSHSDRAKQTMDEDGLLPRLAIQNHDLDTLAKLLALSANEYCQGHAKFSFTTSIDTAARIGSLEMLQWLRDCAGAEYQQGTICTAVHHGNADVVRWLLANFPDCHSEITSELMDSAAGNGYLDVVHIFHEWSTEGCTIRAMDAAATNGHLDVVAFLYERRIEGCTTAALDGAALNGHLHVIEWLMMLGDGRFTEEAICGAITNGHLEVLQCLWESCHSLDQAVLRPGVCKAFPSALVTMPFAMAVFLYEVAPDAFPIDALEVAKSGGRDDIADYLRAVGTFREGSAAALLTATAQHAHESAQSLLDAEVFDVDVLRQALDVSMKTSASTDPEIFALQIRFRQLIDQQALVDSGSAMACFLPLKSTDDAKVPSRSSPKRRRFRLRT